MIYTATGRHSHVAKFQSTFWLGKLGYLQRFQLWYLQPSRCVQHPHLLGCQHSGNINCFFGTHPDSRPPLLPRTHHPFLFSLGFVASPFCQKKPKGSTVPLPVVSPAPVPGATAAVVSAAAARTTPLKGLRADEASDGWHVGDPPKSRHIPGLKEAEAQISGDLDWEKKHLSKGWRCDLKNRKIPIYSWNIYLYEPMLFFFLAPFWPSARVSGVPGGWGPEAHPSSPRRGRWGSRPPHRPRHPRWPATQASCWPAPAGRQPKRCQPSGGRTPQQRRGARTLGPRELAPRPRGVWNPQPPQTTCRQSQARWSPGDTGRRCAALGTRTSVTLGT